MRAPAENMSGAIGVARNPAGIRREENPTMRLTTIVHHLMPFVAVGAGILVLIRPQLLNYIVAAYLILTGVVGLNGHYHFVR
jgi:hypothetical protein